VSISQKALGKLPEDGIRQHCTEVFNTCVKGLKVMKEKTENIIIVIEALQCGRKIDPLLLLFCDCDTVKYVCRNKL
jgi:hypothetical protein